MEHFWDLLFQLMKHGNKTLHAAFIILFSVIHCMLMGAKEPNQSWLLQKSFGSTRIYTECVKQSLFLLGHGLYKVLKAFHRDSGPCWLQCIQQLCQVGWMSFGWWTILDTHGKQLSMKNGNDFSCWNTGPFAKEWWEYKKNLMLCESPSLLVNWQMMPLFSLRTKNIPTYTCS